MQTDCTLIIARPIYVKSRIKIDLRAKNRDILVTTLFGFAEGPPSKNPAKMASFWNRRLESGPLNPEHGLGRPL